MKLRLKNNVDKKEYEFAVDDLEDSGMFWHFNINLYENMNDGEYSYFLYDDDKLVAEGLLQIGNFEISVEEQHTYNNENNYIQYQW